MKKKLILMLLSVVLLVGCSGKTKELEEAIADHRIILLETEEELNEVRDELRKAKLEIEEYKGNKLWGAPDYQTDYDLTNRGEGVYTHKIRFYGKEGEDLFKIEVDEVSIISRGDNLSGEFQLVKIDEERVIFAVGEQGPSSDDTTSYYYYDPTGNIVFIDKLPGRGEDITYHGNGGTLTTRKRGSVLQTWFYKADYRLNSSNKFEMIPKDLYEMNTKVQVKQPLALQKSRTNSTTSVTLQTGEEAVIVASDDVEWCLVRTSKGIEGWFAVDNFYHIRGTSLRADEVFDGLNFAD